MKEERCEQARRQLPGGVGVDPETRDSLILRLADAEDASAWEDFVAIYQPMLIRLARRWGLQDADAHDVAQDVFVAVSRSIDSYSRREDAGFRAWLAKIAHHKFADLLARRRRQAVGSGQSDVHLWLAQLPDKSAGNSRWDLELRRELFQWASRAVRRSVQQNTWQAFERTAIRGLPVDVVAEELGMSTGQVYVARSRVMSRMRRAVEEWGESDAM